MPAKIESKLYAWDAPTIDCSIPHPDYPKDPSRKYFKISAIFNCGSNTDFLSVRTLISAGMYAGDRVRVRIVEPSGIIFDLPVQVIKNPPQALYSSCPKALMYSSSGQTAQVNFALSRDGGPWVVSQSRYFSVERQSLDPLTRPRLDRGSRWVQITYPQWQPSHKVRLRGFTMTGHEDLGWKPMTGGTAQFEIPLSWFQQNRGKQVWLNYALEAVTGSDYQFSRLLYIPSLEVPPASEEAPEVPAKVPVKKPAKASEAPAKVPGKPAKRPPSKA